MQHGGLRKRPVPRCWVQQSRWIEIADESGANAKIGTNYYSALFTYTIADLRPQ